MVGQALRGETPVLKNPQGTREDQAGRKGSIEIGEESLSRERQVIGEMGEIEEMVVGAEESGEEVAMKAKGSEASPTTKGHGDDMLEHRSIRDYVTSKHPQQRPGYTSFRPLGGLGQPFPCFCNAAVGGNQSSGKNLAARLTRLVLDVRLLE